jgi:hypothetical protein
MFFLTEKQEVGWVFSQLKLFSFLKKLCVSAALREKCSSIHP